MNSLFDKVIKKLKSFGYTIYDQYKRSDENEINEYIISTNKMIISIQHKNLYISFEATSKPEEVFNATNMLHQIDEIEKMEVMNSFIFDSNKKLVQGDNAFEIIRKSIENKVLEKYKKEEIYKNILVACEGFNC